LKRLIAIKAKIRLKKYEYIKHDLNEGAFSIYPIEKSNSSQILHQDSQEGWPVAFSWMEARRGSTYCRTKSERRGQGFEIPKGMTAK